MITLPWGTVAAIIIATALGAVCIWLWRRNGGSLPSRPGRTGRDGRDGRTGRDGRDGRVTLTEATADLITELSGKVKQLEKRVQELEIGAADAQNRITILQGELALANSEVTALEELVREQAARIGDLRTENETLRRSMARIMKKTGTLMD